MSTPRVYLDWNATTPLRPEARAAMLAAMDAVGNPSSVHAEGRAARAILAHARDQVAALLGCSPERLVFTSGATEGTAMVLSRAPAVFALPVEHEAVVAWATLTGTVGPDGLGQAPQIEPVPGGVFAWPVANGETGVIQPTVATPPGLRRFADLTQAAGKLRDLPAADFAVVSAHKFGGPKGIGALVLESEAEPLLRGGGQEGRRRAGTENLIGIAGMGAAAEAAARDLADGVWDRVAELRNILEDRLAAAAPDLILFGSGTARLPNTSCLAVPGWRGETQVMQMDLAGFAVSAGSACSSGKSGGSRVLRAMGVAENAAASAIRVSLGPTTSLNEVLAFAATWEKHCRSFHSRAA